MTGPEHYAEAERLIAFVREKGDRKRKTVYGDDPHREDLPGILADAQIHATLALAAATALGTSHTETLAWADVAGTKLSDSG